MHTGHALHTSPNTRGNCYTLSGLHTSELDPGEILTPHAPIKCAKMDNISRAIGKKIDYRETTYCDDTRSRSSLEKFIMSSTNE